MEKAKVIKLFRNGDKKHTPIKVALNLKRFPTMEHLLKHVTQEIKLVTGSVRKICDLQGNPIRRLAEFFDGHEYVACGGEAFKPTTYEFSQGTVEESATEEVATEETATEEVATEEVATEETATEEVATEEVATEEVATEEVATEEVATEEAAAAVEEEVPRYASPTVARLGKLLSSPPKAKLSPAQPVVKHYGEKRKKEEKLEKFGVQVAKAKVIFVFRNADKRHGGERVAVNLKQYPTLTHFYRGLDKLVPLFTGSVRKLCDTTGKQITNLSQLKDGACYVACGGEPYFPLPYQRQT